MAMVYDPPEYQPVSLLPSCFFWNTSDGKMINGTDLFIQQTSVE